MARPPFARRSPYTAGEPPAALRQLDVLPYEFADFLALQRELASSELGFPLIDDSQAEGDLGGTLMEMSALVAHVLALYQDRYGNEAFLGTAQSPASLVKHGRRLAYEPAPGLTASGFVALFAKEGLSGTIPDRFAFSSGAVGEKPAQDYELVEPADVDASTNVLLPRDVVESIAGGVASPITLSQITVTGTDLDVVPGDVVAIAWDGPNGVLAHARFATAVTPDVVAGETIIALSSSVQIPYGGAPVSLLAKPALDVHAFGHDAAAVFDGATSYFAPSGVASNHVFFDREVDDPLAGQPIVRIAGQNLTALRLVVSASGPQQASAHVKLRHEEPQSVSVTNSATSVTTTYKLTPEVVFARTVTRVTMQAATTAATSFARPAVVDRLGRYLTDWQVRAAVRTSRPNETPLASPVVLAGEHTSFLPGRLFALEATGAAVVSAQMARVRSAAIGSGATTVHFDLVDPTETLGPFRLGYVRVLGNIGKLTHGKTVIETLGDSDGVTPFQRLRLGKTPVAHAPAPAGAEPQLEVRVGGVLFRRVLDFVDSGAADAVYLTERDDAGVLTIVFGDGANGAVPPSGKRHVQAVYRKGIGVVGDAAPLAVSKIAKAHPVLERAYNPVVVKGGVDPASPEDVRVEAPLYLASFDRAVSVEDHAKVALRFPGVVRARAFLGETQPGVEGVRVVVADRTGDAPNAVGVADFLRVRRDNTLPFVVVKPNVVDVTLTIGVMFDPAFDEEVVKLELRALLTSDDEDAPGRLTFGARDLGQPLFASQIVEWIERQRGISAFRILTFAVTPAAANPPGVPPGILDTVRADPVEWIRLLPANLTILKLSELA